MSTPEILELACRPISMPVDVDELLSPLLYIVPGDPARGKAIFVSRQTGLCLLCHSAPLPEEKFQGTIGPDLKGAGSRYTEGQLRLRIVDQGASGTDTKPLRMSSVASNATLGVPFTSTTRTIFI